MNELTIDTPKIKCEFIYGVKRFIPPSYDIWKRSWLGKWSIVAHTDDPIQYANQAVICHCPSVGTSFGYGDLLDKFLKEQPHARSEYPK